MSIRINNRETNYTELSESTENAVIVPRSSSQKVNTTFNSKSKF